MMYDSLQSPEPTDWLSIDESERLSAIIEYHQRIQDKLPNARLHATIHAIIENQLAEGILVVKQALNRLQAEGLDRHEAIHAIGSVLSKHIFILLQGQGGSLDPNSTYFKEIKGLTARSWRKQTR